MGHFGIGQRAIHVEYQGFEHVEVSTFVFCGLL
jgi:hypothetical protein